MAWPMLFELVELRERITGLEALQTEHKRAKEGLRESEEKFRKISDTANDAIIMVDNEGNIFYWNKAAEKIFGYMHQEAIGERIQLIIPERYREAHEKGFNEFKTTGQGVVIGKTIELAALKKDRTEFPIELSLSAVKLKGKWNAIGIIRDITMRKHAEEKIIKTTEKLAALGRMAAGVAHELNSPLTGIVTFSHLLSNRIPPEDKTAIEDLQVIIEQAERCSSIITGLLGFSRSMPAEKGVVDVNRTIEYALNIVRNQSKFHNIKIVKDLQPSLPKIKGDSSQIEQVFLNLLINSADAMDDRGNIIIKAVEVDRKEDNYIEIEFADSGPGIPEEYRGQIFDPFFTTKPVGKGTGLGLFVSHGIIQNHGGQMTVKNKPAMGASFFIRLPITK